MSVYSRELGAIVLILQWIEKKEISNTVIAADSYSAIRSIRSGRSSIRTDIINKIFIIMYRMEAKGVTRCFL